MARIGTYIDSSFAYYIPSKMNDEPCKKEVCTLVEPRTLIRMLFRQNGDVPRGSSEILLVNNLEYGCEVGFRGIPRISVFLNVLSIMENYIFPYNEGYTLDVFFNYLQHDQLLLTCTEERYIPNGNTYSNILSFLERTQERCY